MTQQSVRGHAINGQKHYLPYGMLLKIAHNLFPGPMCDMYAMYNRFFFFGGKLRVQAVKVHRIPYATFFAVILVDQKEKEATHSEQVGSESMNQLTHINKLDQLTHWQQS